MAIHLLCAHEYAYPSCCGPIVTGSFDCDDAMLQGHAIHSDWLTRSLPCAPKPRRPHVGDSPEDGCAPHLRGASFLRRLSPVLRRHPVLSEALVDGTGPRRLCCPHRPPQGSALRVILCMVSCPIRMIVACQAVAFSPRQPIRIRRGMRTDCSGSDFGNLPHPPGSGLAAPTAA